MLDNQLGSHPQEGLFFSSYFSVYELNLGEIPPSILASLFMTSIDDFHASLNMELIEWVSCKDPSVSVCHETQHHLGVRD